MKQQTAVEQLMSDVLGLTLQLSNNKISQRTCELKILELFEQAKEMEKQQIIESNCDGQSLHAKSVTNSMMQDNAEAYYSEVYGK